VAQGRTETFSAGVFAAIITITVLEMKSPQGHFLTKELVAHQGTDSTLAASIGSDEKSGRLSWFTQRRFRYCECGRGSRAPVAFWSL